MRPALFLWRDRRGGVAVVGAAGAALACLMAAVVIDGGAIMLEARALQGAADLAALSAARDLSRAQAAAEATARDNAGPDVEVRTAIGVYRPDAAVKASDRFTPTTDVDDANAAEVTVSGAASLWFGRLVLGRDTVAISRRASAAIRPEEPVAMFSIGSRLARLDGGVANQVARRPGRRRGFAQRHGLSRPG